MLCRLVSFSKPENLYFREANCKMKEERQAHCFLDSE